jgi:hypothetical protein
MGDGCPGVFFLLPTVPLSNLFDTAACPFKLYKQTFPHILKFKKTNYMPCFAKIAANLILSQKYATSGSLFKMLLLSELTEN